jgi:DNA-binding NarL/FixJ family response regulator
MPSNVTPTSGTNGIQPIRVLVTDNTAMGAELLAKMLDRDRRFHVLEPVSTPAEILRAAGEHQPNVVILTHLDGDSPARFRTARELRASFPKIRMVIILDSPSGQLVVEAFRAGARGILARYGSIKLLGKCLECVHQGQIWATTEQFQYLIDALVECPPVRLADSKGTPLLSKQEQAVVYWMTEGLSNREIAAQLKLSEHTVKNYVFRIFDKLGVSKRVEVILYALSRREESREAKVSGEEDTIDEDRLLFKWARALAEKGSGMAGFLLGQMYRDGKGTKQDYVSAYAWLHFAKFHSAEIRDVSSRSFERLCQKMTPEEISEGLSRVAEMPESKHNPREQASPSRSLEASSVNGPPECQDTDPMVVEADWEAL